MENNGRLSSGKRTRHIDIRYFFVKDRIDKKEVRVQYCSTQEMVADFFTKPLQGALFIKFRNNIMNIKLETSPTETSESPRSVLGNQVKEQYSTSVHEKQEGAKYGLLHTNHKLM